MACVLTTNGPADVWLNGRHIHRQEHFHHQLPHSVAFQATLQAGRNTILVRLEEVAVRECPYAMALQIGDGALAAMPVRLPTLVEQVARRQLLERVFAAAYLDRDVYGRNDEVVVRWPDTLPESASVALRIQKPSGEIFLESWPVAQAGATAGMVKGMQVPDGAYKIVLMPPPEEYYIGNVRVQHEIPLWVHKNAYAETPYGDYETRRREALADAAEREGGVYSEIARMELERWPEVNVKVILETIAGIDQRADCSDFYMVGLLGMLHRYAYDPAFPPELKSPLEQCVLGFKYWMDEPGSDAMCFWSENHQILFHACEILAGQLYPDQIFSNAGQDGAWHRAKGERMALAWLRKRAGGGFREWDFELLLRARYPGAGAPGRPGRRRSGARVCGGRARQAAVQHGAQLLPRRLWLDARAHLHPADQGRAAGGDRRHRPADVGHGRVQPPHPGHRQPGLRPGLRAAADHRADRRRPARRAMVARAPCRPAGAVVRPGRGRVGGQQGHLQNTGLHALLGAGLPARRAGLSSSTSGRRRSGRTRWCS